MSSIATYIFFDGTCAEAMRFYEKTLGGKIDMMMTHAQSPMADQAPPGAGDRIMHAHLTLPDGGTLLASDDTPGHYKGMSGFSLSLHYDKVEDGKRIFDALADGGHVILAFDKTFWAEGFGMLKDRYGTPWMVNVQGAKQPES
jgi:PhnB protein